MSTVSISMSLPLDSSGFLRRECPKCEREFKWLHTESQGAAATNNASAPTAYFCPYCHQSSPLGSWWTKAQVTYIQALAAADVVGPQLQKFGRDLESLNRPGGLLRFKATGSVPPRPTPLTEPDDMVRVDFPCHQDEPIKVAEGWSGEVSCLVCGRHHPYDPKV